MRVRIPAAFILISLILTSLSGCNKSSAPEASYTEKPHLYDYEQTPEHLGIDTENIPEPELTYKPLNYTPQYGMWFTVNDYPEILMTKTKEEFTAEIEHRFDNAAALGVNTVYVHVRAFGDAYYESELFSQGLYLPAGMTFDPLEIMVECAHERKLSIHAWINPLRCQSDVQMQAMDNRFTLKEWYDDEGKNGTYLSLVDNRWWLCPAYPEVRKLIAAGAAEVVQLYEVDGIHIDDYFYPTSDASFDDEAFAESGMDSLTDFRMEQCSLMVQDIYNAVKSENPDVLFGISPQGTLTGNASQYADVERWCSEEGFCDYIVPQIYFGLKNETAPFADMTALWQGMVTNENIQLILGIAMYKMGQEDIFAGSGKEEWLTDYTVISKETELALSLGLGAAFYSYDAAFESDKPEMQDELDRIRGLLTKRGSLSDVGVFTIPSVTPQA